MAAPRVQLDEPAQRGRRLRPLGPRRKRVRSRSNAPLRCQSPPCSPRICAKFSRCGRPFAGTLGTTEAGRSLLSLSRVVVVGARGRRAELAAVNAVRPVTTSRWGDRHELLPIDPDPARCRPVMKLSLVLARPIGNAPAASPASKPSAVAPGRRGRTLIPLVVAILFACPLAGSPRNACAQAADDDERTTTQNPVAAEAKPGPGKAPAAAARPGRKTGAAAAYDDADGGQQIDAPGASAGVEFISNLMLVS